MENAICLERCHTEGNFGFPGLLSAERRAAWRFQFCTRAFAAGIRKVVVMDASKAEQAAVRACVAALPNPFSMLEAFKEVVVAFASRTSKSIPSLAAMDSPARFNCNTLA